jgi:hypothetical protein
LGKKYPGGVARVRFNKALGQRKTATLLQQPQHKLLQKKASIHQQTARKNVIKAKRLLNARKGQPLNQKAVCINSHYQNIVFRINKRLNFYLSRDLRQSRKFRNPP